MTAQNYENWFSKHTILNICSREHEMHVLYNHTTEHDLLKVLPTLLKKVKVDDWDLEKKIKIYCQYRGFGDYPKMTAKEIAEEIGIPKNQISSRINKLQTNIHRLLDSIILLCTYKGEECRVVQHNQWCYELKTKDGFIEADPNDCKSFRVVDKDPYYNVVDNRGTFYSMRRLTEVCSEYEKTGKVTLKSEPTSMLVAMVI